MALPAILDIRDDLYRALEATGEDDAVAEEIETVLDRLDAFEERDVADRQGIVDEVDNQLLRVEERLNQRDDDEAVRALQAARNRLHIYRDSVEETDENLAVVETDVRQHDIDDTHEELPVGQVTMAATVANTGDPAEVVAFVSFYGDDGDEIETLRGPEFVVPEGDQERVEMEVDVPGDARYYAMSVAEVEGVRDGQSV
ncbi:hypothetical protein [Halorussus sp. MSC15.2]|uniref:hypothetical protein n=1 Tax=Halorussus sp. MSC15.2 TaxID=2283638 RepID=UPI0013D69A8A|nr:hypothetical protein [Halorussus sp. MSC15.2]NEU56555.1 hypothetical protein [Halorussus sp. MSC15.2]